MKIGTDKIVHCLVTMVIVLAGATQGDVGFMAGLVIAITASVAKESYDKHKGGVFSYPDLLADYTGIAIATVIWGISAFFGG